MPKTGPKKPKGAEDEAALAERRRQQEAKRQERLRERRRQAGRPLAAQVRAGAVAMLREVLRYSPVGEPDETGHAGPDYLPFGRVADAFEAGVRAIVTSGTDEAPILEEEARKDLARLLKPEENAAVAYAIGMPPERIVEYARAVERALTVLAAAAGFPADRAHLDAIAEIIDSSREEIFEGFVVSVSLSDEEGGEPDAVAAQLLEDNRTALRQIVAQREADARAAARRADRGAIRTAATTKPKATARRKTAKADW